MKRETRAAVTSGFITGALFPTLQFLLSAALLGGRSPYFRIMPLLEDQWGLVYSFQFLHRMVLVGWTVAVSLSGVLGMICGAAFVKLGSFPFQSTYPRAFFFGLTLYILCSTLLISVLFHSIPHFFLLGLGAATIDAVVFAYLLNHWTQHHP